MRFRAEVTRNANCQQPVDCDTKKVTLENGATWDSADVKANANGCWWQNGGHPYSWRDQLDK